MIGYRLLKGEPFYIIFYSFFTTFFTLANTSVKI